MKLRSNPFLRSASLAASIVFTLGQAASATDYYWDTITTGSWGAGANWSDNPASGGTTGTVPGTADSVFFNQSSVNGAEIITLDADRTIAGITFNNTGTTTFNGNTAGTTARKITLGTGGITIAASTVGNVTFGQANGILTIDTAGTTQTWTNNASTLTAGPVIGSGQLTLTGANASGNTRGQFALDLSAYTGNLILNNSRLANSVAANGFGTTGTILVNSGAQLIVNAANTTNARAVTINGDGWYDNTIQRGAIRFAQSGTFSNTVTLGSDSRLFADDSRTGAFSGKITGGFALTIGNSAAASTGIISFSGGTANDYSGLTTVTTSTLGLNKTAGINAIAGNVLVTNVGTLSNTADNQIANTSTVGVDTSTAVWTLNGKTETIDTLNLSGTSTDNKGFVTGVAGKLTVTNLNVSGGVVTFNSAGAGAQSTITASTVTNTGGRWTFGTASGTQSLVIGSGGLTIGGGSTINVASAATATTFISLDGNVTSQANAASNVISTSGTNAGQLRLNSTRTFDVADGAVASDLTISAIVANGTGTGAITKTGAGLLTLSGANTYSGATTIENGTLAVGAAAPSNANGALGNATSAIALGNATSISSNLSTSLLTSGAFTVARDITVGASNTATTGIYTIGGNSANTSVFSGVLTLNQGLRVTQVASGTTSLTGNITSGASGTQTLTFNNAGAVSQSTGVIGAGTGTIAVTKSGAGTTTLSGANTYTGTTTIGAGILNAGVADGVGTGALGNGGNITFTGGTLQYSAASAGTDYSARFKNSTTAAIKLDNAQAVNLAGVIDSTNTQGLTKSSAGELTLSGASANTYTGLTTVSAGTLTLSKSAAGLNSAIGGDVTVAANGTLQLGASNQISDTAAVTLSASNYAYFVLNGYSETVGSISGGSGSVIQYQQAGTGGSSVLTFGDASDKTFSGFMRNVNTGTGTLAIVKQGLGKQTLSGTQINYTGATTINAGTLELSGATNFASSVDFGASSTGILQMAGATGKISGLSSFDATNNNAFLQNAAGTDNVLTINQAGTTSFGGILRDNTTSNKLGIIKSGVGTLTLSNASNTYSAGTAVNAGALKANAAGALGSTSGVLAMGGGQLDLNGLSHTVGAVTVTAAATSVDTITNGSLTGASYAASNTTGNAIISANLLVNGAAGFAKSGAGTVTLSGNNTFSGDVTLSGATAGQINVNSATALGTGTFTIYSGDLAKIDATTTFGVANTLTSNNAQNWNNNFAFVGTNDLNMGTGAVTLGGSRQVTVTAKNLTIGGVIDDDVNSYSLTKLGGGTLTLAGANTYNGATAINAGILAITNKDALNGTSGITVGTANSSTTSLRIDVPDATSTMTGSGKSVTVRGLGSGNLGALLGKDSTSVTWAGGVVLGDTTGARIGGGASGTLTVDGVISEATAGSAVIFSRAAGSTTILNKVNTYTGDTGMYANGAIVTLKMDIANAISSSSRVWASTGGATGTEYFDLNGFNQNIRALLDDQAADLVVTNSSLTNDAELKLSTTIAQSFNGWIQDGVGLGAKKTSLVMSGVGSQNFSGINTYTGGTRIDGGTLTLGHATNTLADTGAINVNGGTLVLGTNTDTVGAVTLTSGNITGTTGKLTGSGSNFDVRSGTISSKLGGTIGLDKTTGGTVTISSDNSTGGYTGATTVSAGTLIIDGNISTSTTTVSGTGILAGSGTVGDLTIAAGGTHNPGNSPGIMNTGDYTMAGTLNIESIGNTPGIGGYDQVNATGTVNLSGTLATSFTAGTYANGNLLFILLNDGGDAVSGNFATLTQGAIVTNYGGFDWQISYTADSTGNTFTGGNDIALMAIPEPNVAALLGGLGTLLLLRRRRTA